MSKQCQTCLQEIFLSSFYPKHLSCRKCENKLKKEDKAIVLPPKKRYSKNELKFIPYLHNGEDSMFEQKNKVFLEQELKFNPEFIDKILDRIRILENRVEMLEGFSNIKAENKTEKFLGIF